MSRRRRWRDWRWVLSNVLIVAGVLALLYPVGTWAFTWWQQRGLEKQLVAESPIMAQPAAEVFTDDMLPTEADRESFRSQEEKAQHEIDMMALRTAAEGYAEGLDVRDSARPWPLGRLIIPSIGVDTVVVEGTGHGDLREGPGHWPETPIPGMGGNFVLSGHRTTYGAPFFRLDKVKPGDRIDLLLPYVAATYRVTRTLIVLPDETEEVAQRGVEEISLATCHPIYSARQRLLVQAEMVSFKVLSEDGSQGDLVEVLPGDAG